VLHPRDGLRQYAGPRGLDVCQRGTSPGGHGPPNIAAHKPGCPKTVRKKKEFIEVNALPWVPLLLIVVGCISRPEKDGSEKGSKDRRGDGEGGKAERSRRSRRTAEDSSHEGGPAQGSSPPKMEEAKPLAAGYFATTVAPRRGRALRLV